MAVIQFDESDKLAGTIMEKGPYSAIITEIDGPKASQSGKSNTFFTTFKITEGPYMNKELTIAFNSGTSNGSVLGGLQFLPHREIMKVAAAVDGIPYKDVNLLLDTDDLLDKPLDIMVATETSDGNIVNVITGFAPTGTMKSVPF